MMNTKRMLSAALLLCLLGTLLCGEGRNHYPADLQLGGIYRPGRLGRG